MEKISIVSSPDDVYEDSARIMLVDLSTEQQTTVSTALKSYSGIQNVTVYVWSCGLHDTTWLFDKTAKCDLIIFNAESSCSQIVGYMAAQPRSYYFGRLQDVNIANTREILSLDTITQLLEII